MSTLNKPANRAHKVMTPDCKRQEIQACMALDVIKSKIQSEISPANKEYLVLGKDGKPKSFRAGFAFKVNLRRYLSLQSLAIGEKRTLSSMITFTSAGSDVDALAVPASTYIRDTWGQDGTKILQMVENALKCTEIRAFVATLTHGNQISITIYQDHLLLNIRGARTSFAKIIEQVCWLAGVAGDTPSSRLASFVKETNQGTTTRGYTETIHTGHPVIEAGKGCCFNVSFSEARIERQTNQSLVKKPGHCWKTMTELSIVASGFAIPSRPRESSGLEAPLFVLRQLVKRGCHGRRPLPSDKTMVFFPPSKVERADKSGKVVQVYKMRLILAAGSERPLRKQGNVIYWHFDPARICKSVGSIQQMEDGINVDPSAVDPNSRHFVGWSNDAGHLTAAPRNIPLGCHSELNACPHYQLIIPALSANLRLSQLLSVGGSLATDKVATTIPKEKMLGRRDQQLANVSGRLFVLWDKVLERGWLVAGDTVALHLLRVHLKNIDGSKDFDFTSLDELGTEAKSASKVLDQFNPKKDSLNELQKAEEKPDNSDNKQPAETRKEAINRVIGEFLDGVYAVLLQMTEHTAEMNKRQGLAGPVQMWFERKWSTTIRGWDFDDIAGNRNAQIYTYKMEKDPGWLRMVREENATFLFVSGLGEIMEPTACSCCPYFPTLPCGMNLIASNMRVLEKLIKKYGGNEEVFLPDRTVARLSHNQGWQRRLHPFARPNCQGDHLDTLDPSCFPVQGFQTAPLPEHTKQRLEKDSKLLKDKALHTRAEIKEMIKNNENGVVVFGRQPGSEELKEIYRRSRHNKGPGTQQTADPAPVAAQTSSRPSTGGSTPGSTGPATETGATRTTQPGVQGISAEATRSGSWANASRPETVTQNAQTGPQQRTPSMSSQRSTASASEASGAVKNRTGQSSSTLAQRAASISSVRSTTSNSESKARSNAVDHGGCRTSSPQPLANSTHKTASNASLRSTGSNKNPAVTNAGSSRPGESTAARGAPTATRKASSSSVRTTSWAASQATGRSDPQAPAGQPSTAGLKKTATSSSDKTTSSRSSKCTQNSRSGTTAAENRQRQQRLEQQLGATTAAAGNLAPGQPASSNHGASSSGTTENLHSTSSGLAPMGGRGSEGSY